MFNFWVCVCSMFARWGSIPQRSWCLVTLLFIGEPNLKALHSPPWVGLGCQIGRHCTALTGAWPFALNTKNLPDAGFSLRLSICSDFAGSDRGVQLPFGGVTSPLVLRFQRLFVGRIFVSIFLSAFFGPVLSTCREGTPVTCFFSVFPAKRFFGVVSL